MSIIETIPSSRPPKASAKSPASSARTWTDDRLALLREGFDAGLTCREIADSLGLSRNAVIGKLSRLSLTRDRPEGAPRPPAGTPKPRRARIYGPPRLVRALRAAPEPIDDAPIHAADGCSFMELTAEQCRWPLTTPTELRFCGNPRAEGLSYCPGHARLAYRAGTSRRAS